MLKLEGVGAAYGPVPVLHDVSLEVNQGEAVAIVGANNAGKSTTLRTIAGLLKPTAGKITFDGQDLSRLGPQDIVNLGVVMVPEGRGVFPDMTVEENLLMGSFNPRGRKERPASFPNVYRLFPVLDKRRKQIASTLSGGEQQMLAIGRGLMAQPKILLLDEPSLGLGPLLIREVYRVLQDLNRQGLTILLVEQNVRVSLAITSRAYVLLHGRVFLSGKSQELARDERVKKAYLGMGE